MMILSNEIDKASVLSYAIISGDINNLKSIIKSMKSDKKKLAQLINQGDNLGNNCVHLAAMSKADNELALLE